MNHSSLRILIVEDSETQAVMLKYKLEDLGYFIDIQSNAEMALEYMNRVSPNLIIIDYNLPGMQGDELCRRLKMNINTRGIPILFFTVTDGQEAEKQFLESGADDYLPKNVEDEILFLRIKMLVRESGLSGEPVYHGIELFKRSRILAVDDSPTYLEFLKASFEESGIEIDCIDNSQEALMLLKTGKYDCALVDLVMPGMDGIELCGRILEIRKSFEEPIVVLMLTAHESKEDMTRALEAGADDFVGKSNDTSIIKARLAALLRRKFIQEDNQRILEELRLKELEAERSRIEKEASQAKASLAEELEKTVEKLEQEIRERRVIEEKLNHTMAELARSNKDLEQFAYVVSHDLQEPLRKISSYLLLIKEEHPDLLNQSAGEYIDSAVNGADRMKAMINDLLRLSRLGTRTNPYQKVDSETILKEVLRDLDLSIQESHASITHGELPSVYVDPFQFGQLLSNLIGNAIKYRGKATPEIRISAKRDKLAWRFAVKDNGIGIDPRHFDRIFQIFQRLHSRTAYEGTGIGLAVCKKIVERHGGSIGVQSEPGNGSEFFFMIPDQQEESHAR